MSAVLVVDDDESIRTLVNRLLTRGGYEVTVAADGVEALERMRERTFDAVVLDLMMPRMSGHEVIDVLSEEQPEMLDRIVIVTAFSKKIPEFLRDRVCRLIYKPFDVSALLDAVAECTRGGSS